MVEYYLNNSQNLCHLAISTVKRQSKQGKSEEFIYEKRGKSPVRLKILSFKRIYFIVLSKTVGVPVPFPSGH